MALILLPHRYVLRLGRDYSVLYFCKQQYQAAVTYEGWRLEVLKSKM